MKKTAKLCGIAACLCLLGLFIAVCGLVACGFDFSLLSTQRYETNIYPVSEDFRDISLDVVLGKVTLAPSEDGTCRVVCHEAERMKHAVTVENGTLTVRTQDTREWYDYISITTGGEEVTLYLPQSNYERLSLYSNTGSISVPSGFSFSEAEMGTDTGSIGFSAAVEGLLSAETDTGSIALQGASAGELRLSCDTGSIRVEDSAVAGDVSAATGTGDIDFVRLTCGNVEAESGTGGIGFSRTVAKGKLTAETGTGPVRFELSDAASLTVQTGTGSVTGSLLTGKRFYAESSTGRKELPADDMDGGECRITTGTGSILITVESAV